MSLFFLYFNNLIFTIWSFNFFTSFGLNDVVSTQLTLMYVRVHGRLPQMLDLII